jgi:hypothetical protein
MTDLFSKLYRDEALERVQKHAGEDWMASALRCIERMERGLLVTGEDIRHKVKAEIGSPHHHNAYGALVMAAVKRHLIVKTGQWTNMRDKRSHARMTPVYRKL